jgi:hypothetical protein
MLSVAQLSVAQGVASVACMPSRGTPCFYELCSSHAIQRKQAAVAPTPLTTCYNSCIIAHMHLVCDCMHVVVCDSFARMLCVIAYVHVVCDCMHVVCDCMHVVVCDSFARMYLCVIACVHVVCDCMHVVVCDCTHVLVCDCTHVLVCDCMRACCV